MKNNVDKAEKALFKLDVLMSKIDLEIDTKIHLIDVMIKPILLYGGEVWGHEVIEQIEVFHRKFLRRLLRLRLDLTIQSWHTMLNSTSLCDCYRGFKHRLLLKPYLQK